MQTLHELQLQVWYGTNGNHLSTSFRNWRNHVKEVVNEMKTRHGGVCTESCTRGAAVLHWHIVAITCPRRSAFIRRGLHKSYDLFFDVLYKFARKHFLLTWCARSRNPGRQNFIWKIKWHIFNVIQWTMSHSSLQWKHAVSRKKIPQRLFCVHHVHVGVT